MYKFTGVPKVFQTREQAMQFLRSSPGYVRRQSSYLQTYWPGLYAEVKAPPGPVQWRANKAPQAPPGTGIDTIVARAAKAAGIAVVNAPAALAPAAPAKLTRSLVRPGTTGKDITPGPIIAAAAKAEGKSLLNTAVTAAAQPAKLTKSLVRPGTTGSDLSPADFGHAWEGVGDVTLGKGLTNLAQGQLPKNLQDVLGLGVGVLGVLPLGKASKLGASAIEAGRAARAAGKVADVVPPLPHPDDLAWAGAEFKARGGARARATALPKNIKSPVGLTKLVADLRRRMFEGYEYAKDWYPESGAAIRAHSGSVEEADKLAALTAIYSPQQSVVPNIGLALKAKEAKRLGETLPGNANQQRRAALALEGNDWMVGYTPDQAQKTRSFYANLLKHIDPELMRAKGFTGREVTADGWIAAAFGHGTNTDNAAKFTPDGYRFMERTIQKLADEAGIEPEVAQAAIWASIKANNDARLTARYLAPATRHGAMEEAGVHFQEGLEKPTHTVRFAFEAASDAIPEYAGWAPHVQQAFLERNAKHVLEVFQAEGLTARLTDFGIGIYKNPAGLVETNPAAAIEVAIGTRPKGDYALPAAHRALFDGLAGAVASGLKQEAVGWLRPLVPLAKKDYTFFRVDGDFSPAQLSAIGDALDDAGGYATQTSHGFMAVMFDPEAVHSGAVSNKPFADTLHGLIGEHGGDMIEAGTHNGGYVESASARRAIDNGGQRDLQDRIHSGLADRANATQAEFVADPAGAAARHAAADTAPSGLAARLSEEGGSLALSRPPERVRALTLNEMVQEFPTARSRVTRAVLEDPADRVSRALMGEGLGARIGRVLLPTASTVKRIAHQAGMRENRLGERALSWMRSMEQLLPDEGSIADVAHFWWAQLTPTLRNVGGLRIVKNQQEGKLAELTTGKRFADLKSQLEGISAELRNGDGADRFKLLEQRAEVQAQMDDIPGQIEALGLALTRLDEAIAKPPELDPKIIRAIHELSEERQRILEEAGVLSSEGAEERKSIVSDLLGTERGGEEYLGHRMAGANVRGSRPGPAAPGLGRPSSPQGVGSQNRLVLANTGRLRDSTRVAYDDWLAAQTYQSAIRQRDFLGKIGVPYSGRVNLKEGELLVNTKGRIIPPHWKVDPMARIAADGFDEEAVRAAAKDMVDSFVADSDHFDDMLERAQELGHNWDDLRVVKEEDAQRYFAQFQTPSRAGGKLGAAGKVYDSAVDFAVASIIFARIGYIPKNVVANLIMAVPHQGVYMFANIPRATQLIVDAIHGSVEEKRLLHMMIAEVGGSGPTKALEREGRLTQAKNVPGRVSHALTTGVSNVADTPLRLSALIHEMAAAGVIPKYSPSLSAADKTAMINFLRDPANESLLNNVRSRGVEAMADFSRLTPTQRRWARRFVVIPGWLWAGSRYPVHFAATHPGRTAAIGYVAAGEPGLEGGNDPIWDHMPSGLPPWATGIGIGDKVLRTGAISPVSTPWDLVKAAVQKDGQTIGDLTQPLAASIWNVAHSEASSPTGNYKTSFGDSLLKAGKRLLPDVTLAGQLIHPKASKVYPDDATRLGRLKREIGIIPIKVNRTQGTSEKAYSTIFKERGELATALTKIDGGTKLAPYLREAYNLKAMVESARATARKKFPHGGLEYSREAIRREATVYLSLTHEKPGPKYLDWISTASEEELDDERRTFDWDSKYLSDIREARAYAKDHGAVLEFGNH